MEPRALGKVVVDDSPDEGPLVEGRRRLGPAILEVGRRETCNFGSPAHVMQAITVPAILYASD